MIGGKVGVGEGAWPGWGKALVVARKQIDATATDESMLVRS